MFFHVVCNYQFFVLKQIWIQLSTRAQNANDFLQVTILYRCALMCVS